MLKMKSTLELILALLGYKFHKHCLSSVLKQSNPKFLQSSDATRVNILSKLLVTEAFGFPLKL